MIELNLEANGNEQIIIKKYLQENVSGILADKINNGVKIEKENKILFNKKDLNGFMKYANEEARKLAEKGATSACVEDKIVFGWAIHYFEEDSIEGNLFNEDGTKFKVEAKVKTVTKTIAKAPIKEQKKQTSLFDFMDLSTNEPEESDEDEEIEEEFTEEEMDEIIDNENLNNQTMIDSRLVDTETGEVIQPNTNKNCPIDKEFAIILYNLLDGKLEVK